MSPTLKECVVEATVSSPASWKRVLSKTISPPSLPTSRSGPASSWPMVADEVVQLTVAVHVPVLASRLTATCTLLMVGAGVLHWSAKASKPSEVPRCWVAPASNAALTPHHLKFCTPSSLGQGVEPMVSCSTVTKPTKGRPYHQMSEYMKSRPPSTAPCGLLGVARLDAMAFQALVSQLPWLAWSSPLKYGGPVWHSMPGTLGARQ